ncbi:hypothetical protein MES4922_290068 [Mesorhizobium ventifaucium]|uniref:Uncharacterized protein n=1 Tax=Mesorhizobium ventifaucium TaxID=666020 RepID=A0ABM9DWK6_9HYPH|nr:hypothetical protein MES4922_290068 [Mesorhizobium ventifaucium]
MTGVTGDALAGSVHALRRLVTDRVQAKPETSSKPAVYQETPRNIFDGISPRCYRISASISDD